MKIPFDSLSTAAVVSELQVFVGSKLERAAQPDARTLVLGFYDGGERWVVASVDREFARIYPATRRPEFPKDAPSLATEIRKRLHGSELTSVRQIGRDRVVEFAFRTETESYRLMVEATGRHGNIVLVDGRGRAVAAAEFIGPARSVRPVLPGGEYALPPVPDGDGSSPFLRKLLAAGGDATAVDAVWQGTSPGATFVPGSGAYPVDVAALGLDGVSRASIGQALEQHFESAIAEARFRSEQAGLRSQLERVLLARDVALRDLAEALDAARNARRLQLYGELILAYQSSIPEGARILDAWDYDGQEVAVPLKPDASALENAERYFSKAKKAKSRADELRGQNDRLTEDREALLSSLAALESADDAKDLDAVREAAARRRWLQRPGTAVRKEDRPFEGHAVRELLSPGGWRVLYGENATSNDYLTTKVAKPADLWFHVRGAPSAHVVLCTDNRPDKVQRADIEFAAKVAVDHSSSKHSSYVSVDYTQKRYVRRPKGSQPGLAVYTREKTVHVTSR
ncbi:MAG: NFACT family protein [Armatimonadetes bacterium]|nr:NFACT family protein [Armatimonadota bacterium]